MQMKPVVRVKLKMNDKEERSQSAKKILALDPGQAKIGLALVTFEGLAVRLQIVSPDELEEVITNIRQDYELELVVIGSGTASTGLTWQLQKILPEEIPVQEVEEAYSTEAAEELYFQINQPGLLKSLLRKILKWRPARPVDDYAALVLARRYLNKNMHKN